VGARAIGNRQWTIVKDAGIVARTGIFAYFGISAVDEEQLVRWAGDFRFVATRRTFRCIVKFSEVGLRGILQSNPTSERSIRMSQQPGQFQKEDLVEVWNAVSAGYDESTYWQLAENHANLEVLLSYLGNPQGKRVIEIGSGGGFVTLALAQRGARCALLDISPVALQNTAAAFERAGLPKPPCFQKDALQSGLPDGAYDMVWNGGVIEHFLDDGKALLIQEMLRICAPGGVVVILVPNRLCWQFQLRQAWQKMRRTWKYGFEDDMSPGRLLRMARRLRLTGVETYAFNPVAGWHWIPRTTRILRWLGWETVERHTRRSITGLVSVLAIKKPPSPSSPPSVAPL